MWKYSIAYTVPLRYFSLQAEDWFVLLPHLFIWIAALLLELLRGNTHNKEWRRIKACSAARMIGYYNCFVPMHTYCGIIFWCKCKTQVCYGGRDWQNHGIWVYHAEFLASRSPWSNTDLRLKNNYYKSIVGFNNTVSPLFIEIQIKDITSE